MSDNDIIESMLVQVSLAMDFEEKFVKRMFMRGVVKQWNLDPFTLGGITHPSIGQVGVAI